MSKTSSHALLIFLVFLLSQFNPYLLTAQENRTKKENIIKEEIKGPVISYSFSGGRFGDNLLAFAHALWFSHSLKMPLVYKPFPYSDQLKLHQSPLFLKDSLLNHLTAYRLQAPADYLEFFRLLQASKSPLTAHILDKVLIEVPFYPESAYLFEKTSSRAQFTKVNWDDPQFLQLLRELIAPVTPLVNSCLPNLTLPANCKTVALHFRSGLNFDKQDKLQRKFPLKSPPESFYVEALHYLYKTVDLAAKQSLYVYIFTDHPNPQEVCKKFSQQFSKEAILFDCNRGESRQDLNVLEDFFALGNFDCLIRPDSHYSILASLLFPYEIAISPTHFQKQANGAVIVDHFLIEYRHDKNSLTPIRTFLRK